MAHPSLRHFQAHSTQAYCTPVSHRLPRMQRSTQTPDVDDPDSESDISDVSEYISSFDRGRQSASPARATSARLRGIEARCESTCSFDVSCNACTDLWQSYVPLSHLIASSDAAVSCGGMASSRRIHARSLTCLQIPKIPRTSSTPRLRDRLGSRLA